MVGLTRYESGMDPLENWPHNRDSDPNKNDLERLKIKGISILVMPLVGTFVVRSVDESCLAYVTLGR